MSRIAHLLRRGRDQDGAVIVIVAILLVCFLGAGALATDLSAGRQSEQRAQAGADAGATAGADQIVASNPASTPLATVTTTASNEAVDNGACATCVTVTYPYKGDPTRVFVAVSGTSGATVGGEFGRSTIPVSASAVAVAVDNTSTIVSTTPTVITNLTPTTGDQVTTSSGSTTITSTSTSITHSTNAILFAGDTSCSGGITMSGNSGTSITGETFSNGGLHIDKPSDYNFNGPVYYQSGCPSSGVSGATATAPVSGWPEDFTGDIAAICGTTHLPTANIDIENKSNDHLGTGPMCTTGSITIKGNSGLTGNVTFVGGTIDIEGNSGTRLTSYFQDLLFYQTGSNTMNIINGSDYPGGTIFAPNATVKIDNDSGLGQNAPGGYIEAKDITITGSSGTTIHGAGTGAAATTSTSSTTITQPTSTVITNHTPTTITNTTSTTGLTSVTSTSSSGSALAG
jgi:trimeric autotransporter adhesin